MMSKCSLALALAASACSFKPTSGGGQTDGRQPDMTVYLDARVDGAPNAAKYKIVTVVANKIGGVVPGFPLWLATKDPDLAARATASGIDIYFTKLDGTPLPFERTHWDKTNGQLAAWVKVDLDSTITNAFELRYGDPGPATMPSSAAVFANGFVSVWHLDDALANTTVVDATGTANGTASGLATAQQVSAQLGGGFAFNGTSSQIAFTNHLTGNSPHTISAWIDLKQPTDQGFAAIVTVGTAMPEQARFFHTKYSPNLASGFYGDDLTGGPDVSDNKFHLVHWTYDGTKSVLYKDGAIATMKTAGTVATLGAAALIGNSAPPFTPGGNTSNFLNGTLDEVRIANVARSQAWITTELNNQTMPNAFYTIGTEQTVP
jgi:MSHA biogenesis protein MshQ